MGDVVPASRGANVGARSSSSASSPDAAASAEAAPAIQVSSDLLMDSAREHANGERQKQKQNGSHPLEGDLAGGGAVINGRRTPPAWSSFAEKGPAQSQPPQPPPLQSAAARPPGKRPVSSYYYGPVGSDTAFGTDPVGVIGRDHPREIVRIERDYSATEVPQFYAAFPLELEGRISPERFTNIMCDMNEVLLAAHSRAWACLDNVLAVLSLYVAPLVLGSKYKRELARLTAYIDKVNRETLNPAGLNMVHPKQTAFLFLEIEYF